MQLRTFLGAVVLALSLTSCSTVQKVVYRIDVPQGNYLEQDKIDQLKVGMNQEQVQYLLGTPLLRDVFAQNRWDYVFIKREGHNDPIRRTLLVYFDNKGFVKDIKLDDIKDQKIVEEKVE